MYKFCLGLTNNLPTVSVVMPRVSLKMSTYFYQYQKHFDPFFIKSVFDFTKPNSFQKNEY